MIERVDSLSLDRFFIYVSFNYSTVLYCRLKLFQYTITMYADRFRCTERGSHIEIKRKT